MSDVRRSQSNILVDCAKKIGCENELNELSPTTYKDFNDRFYAKYREGFDSKYIKPGLPILTLSIFDTSFIEHGRAVLLSIINQSEILFVQPRQGFVYESKVFSFLEAMNVAFQESSGTQPYDGFTIWNKKLEWFMQTTTVKDAIRDDSLVIVGSQDFVNKAEQISEGFKKIWNQPYEFKIEKSTTEKNLLI